MGNLAKIVGLFTAFTCCQQQSFSQAPQRYEISRSALGSNASITTYGTDSAMITKAMVHAFELLDSFDQIFSDYKASSEVMILVEKPAHTWTSVSLPLYDLIDKSIGVSHMTDGRFTVTIGALTHLWRRYLTQGEIPKRRLIRRARKTAPYKMVSLASDSLYLKKNKKGLRFDFGGIAKGYIADHMAKVMVEHGVPVFLINLGGDLLAGDAPPGKPAWKVEIPWCEKIIEIENEAVATSGPDYQFFVHKGMRYAHIIDPDTGWGVKYFFAATVIAKSGWQADAFASAFSILPIDKSTKIMQKRVDFSAIIGMGNELFQSKNFSDYVVN